jgi:elongation factor G
MANDLDKLRNLGIMAHIDAGKTTISERVLYYAGKIYKMGEVHEGTAVMDYLEEEQERGITITSAATKCQWRGYPINLIDTPGHVDFTAEVERSLRVLDGAVAVLDASEGVQAQTETVWRQANKYGVPCLFFINKMDKLGADFETTYQSIHDKLVAHPVPVQYPIGQDSTFEGIIDLVTMKAVYYKQEKLGASFEERDIPPELAKIAHDWHLKLLEVVAEFDEHVMDAFVHDGPVDVDILKNAIRKGVCLNKLNPVFIGSALRYVGVQRLLDGVIDYLPSPLDKPVLMAHKPGEKERNIEIKCDAKEPLVALAFKVTGDQHGDLYFLRIYQGTLKSGTRLLNANRNSKENVTRLFEMHAADRTILESASAGDIVAAVGLKDTLTGDTLCDTRHPVQLETITFPETVVSMSIEPKTSAERAKLGDALGVLRREDPTFGCKYDPETGQTIISGMGELHLEIIQHKLIRTMKVDVRIGKPKVAYKEAITGTAEAQGKFVRQTGGHGQFGDVYVTVEPLYNEDGSYTKEIEFESKIVGGSVPKEYWKAVEHGAKEALSSGPLAGYPLVGVKVCLIDGSFHAVDSSELAFEQAGAIGVLAAIKKANPILLEPIMKLQVVVPESNFGSIQGNIISKRGMITDSRLHGAMRVIEAKVPLAEMFGYSSEIRSATAGRGTFVMEPLSYERVPAHIAEKILETFS